MAFRILNQPNFSGFRAHLCNFDWITIIGFVKWIVALLIWFTGRRGERVSEWIIHGVHVGRNNAVAMHNVHRTCDYSLSVRTQSHWQSFMNHDKAHRMESVAFASLNQSVYHEQSACIFKCECVCAMYHVCICDAFHFIAMFIKVSFLSLTAQYLILISCLFQHHHLHPSHTHKCMMP